MPFVNPPTGPPNVSQSKFFVPSLLGTTVAPAVDDSRVLVTDFVTRVGKKLKRKVRRATFVLFHPDVVVTGSIPEFQERVRKTTKKAAFKLLKLARFTTWHTDLQPSVIVLQFQTRVRSTVKKAGFKFRKIARFTQFHFTQTFNVNVVKFHTRVRSVQKKTGFKLRKLSRFTVFHFTQPFNIGTVAFKTRVRKVQKKAGLQLRKLARFTNWHFTAPVVVININTSRLTTRRSLKSRRKQGKHARFFPLFNTGEQRSVLLSGFRTRRGRSVRHSFQAKKIARLVIWHVPPPAPGGGRLEWVSPHVSHSRGNQG